MNIWQVFSDVVSTITILSCMFLKVPQIMAVKQKKSSQGIYIQALIMEITGYSIVTLYNFTNRYSMMTYLEYPIILLQVYVLLYYILKFKELLQTRLVSVLTVLYPVIVMGFVLDFIPKDILNYLLPFCTPLSGFAKVTYIYGMIKMKNADSVSLTTWVISVLTNIARIFTVYMDSGDLKLITNFAVSTILSLAVFVTALVLQSKDYFSQLLNRPVFRGDVHQHEN